MKILNLILDESRTKPKNPIIESILSKLKSRDEVVLYINGAAMPGREQELGECVIKIM